MFFKTQKMLLNVVRKVFSGEVNDIYVCNNINSRMKSYYTVHIIKEHNIASMLLKAFHEVDSSTNMDENAYIDCFTVEDNVGFVFSYYDERNIDKFYMGNVMKISECESTCLNLVVNCISSNLPYPFMYLILSQHHINLEKDGSVYFTYMVDLKEYDNNKYESDCAQKCAEIIIGLLEQSGIKKIKSLELIRKKSIKNGYGEFSELFRDIKLTSVSEKSQKIWIRIKNFIVGNKDLLFRVLLVVSMVLVLSAVAILISQLFFGDISLFKLFSGPIKKIGTESLV